MELLILSYKFNLLIFNLINSELSSILAPWLGAGLHLLP